MLLFISGFLVSLLSEFLTIKILLYARKRKIQKQERRKASFFSQESRTSSR
jgi:hypothetical protein